MTIRCFPWRSALILSFIVLIGGLLRLAFALQFPLWADEALQWDFAQDLKWESLDSPPSHALTALFLHAFGKSELTLRLPSIILGCLNIVMLYQIGRSCCSQGAALFFSGLYAINPLMVYTDSYGRMYSLWMFGVCLVVLVLVWIDSIRETTLRRSWLPWVLLGFSLAFSLWVHILSAYIWLAVAIGLSCAGGISRKALGAAIKGLMLAFGTAVPLSALRLYTILGAMQQAFVLGHKEQQSVSTGIALRSALTELSGTPVFLGVPFTGTPVFVGMMALGLIGLLLLLRRRPRLAWPLLVMMPCSLFVLSTLHQAHFLTGRYLYPLFIPIYLGAILAVVRLAEIGLGNRPTVRIGVLATLTLLIVAARLHQDFRDFRARQDADYGMYADTRALIYVRDHASHEDTIVLIPPSIQAIGDFYALPGKLAHGHKFGESWADGYGYSAAEMPGPGGPSLWIVIRPKYSSGEWAKMTEEQLASLLCRPLNQALTHEQLDRLMKFTLIKIVDGRLTAAHTRDLVAEQRGQGGPALQDALERPEHVRSFR